MKLNFSVENILKNSQNLVITFLDDVVIRFGISDNNDTIMSPS
ncbi:MAG: hypothetical protein CM1200mP13_08860 [Candidatus Pelagibacterales bacterium]|nr:MAG: hypothetical protein CM1200mP13_08860 [Pelagibacterales bacterium]